MAQQRVEFPDIECLQVVPRFQHHVSLVRSQSLNLSPGAKMIVHAIELAGTWSTAVNQHYSAKLGVQLWIELAKRFV
jgi:hypothetical protein